MHQDTLSLFSGALVQAGKPRSGNPKAVEVNLESRTSLASLIEGAQC